MPKYLILVIGIFLYASVGTGASLPEHQTDDCLTNSLDMSASASLYCRGSRYVHNVLNNLSKNDKPIVLLRGLEIVPSSATAAANSEKPAMNKSSLNVTSYFPVHNDAMETDDTLLGHFAHYLRTHELNIKFSDLMAEESELAVARDLEQNGMQMNAEARKKDKGNGMIMAVIVMFSKMMAIMGLGGIGAMAMKALGIAMTALMMAGMVGMKSLAQHGNESSHSVQYVAAEGGHHHKRRRRSNISDMANKLSDKQDNSGGWHLQKGETLGMTNAMPLAYRNWN